MSTKRTVFVTAVYLFLEKDDKVLLARRFNTGFEDGNYSTIAGHLEENETIISSIIREAKEEAGIKVLEKDLKLFHVMTRKTETNRIDFFFKTSKWLGNPKICETNLCDDMKWVAKNNLPQNTIPYIQKVIKTIDLPKITYSKIW